MPSQAITKLIKFIQNERERGFDNRTVIGGLDKVLGAWVAEARIENVPEPHIALVVEQFSTYPDLDINDRKSSLDKVWSEFNLDQLVPLPKQIRASRPIHPRVEDTGNSKVIQKTTHPTVKAQPTVHSSIVRTQEDAHFGLEASLQVLPGIGPVKAKSLGQLGLKTLGDLLYYFPRRYDDYSQLKTIRELTYGQDVTVIASVQEVNTHPIRNRSIKITEASVGDGTATLRLTWFNQPWIARRLHPGKMLSISGRVDQYLGRPVINNPDFEELDTRGRAPKPERVPRRIVPMPEVDGAFIRGSATILDDTIPVDRRSTRYRSHPDE